MKGSRDRQRLQSNSGVSELVKKLLISNNKAEQREREGKREKRRYKIAKVQKFRTPSKTSAMSA